MILFSLAVLSASLNAILKRRGDLSDGEKVFMRRILLDGDRDGGVRCHRGSDGRQIRTSIESRSSGGDGRIITRSVMSTLAP